VATEIMFELGTETITEFGTEFGTFSQETTANDGDDATTTTWVDGSEDTNESGTTTGLDQVDGK